jgi:hypothetical protein
MAAASLALQRVIVEALSADPELAAALGPNKIFDRVPRNAEPPYVTFGSISTDDWSTGTERGDEHVVTLNVWSDALGRADAAGLMARVAAVLDDRPLVLIGHRLVSLRHERSETRRRNDGDKVQGVMRLRARTERLD